MILCFSGENVASKTEEIWLVYKDETWNYSIRYPFGWQPEIVFQNSLVRPSHVIRQRVSISEAMDAEVTIDVWQKDLDVELLEWIRQNEPLSSLLTLGGIEIPLATNAVISGQEALFLAKSGSCMSPALFFTFINASDRVLLVQYIARDNGSASNLYFSMVDSISLGINLQTVEPNMFPEVQQDFSTPASTCEFAPNADGCCGYPQIPHWQCSRDTSTHTHKGNCTFWAAYKRPDVGAAVGSGDAGEWAYKADLAGCDVNGTPQTGDIMVIEGSPGHVAYVTSLSDGNVNVTEMNWCSTCPERSWTYTSSGKRFIHSCGGDCPSSGGVILYRGAYFDCEEKSEGGGWVRRSGTGWQNVGAGFNDQASSVRVPSGWSVKLFEHDNRGGDSKCFSADELDFQGDYFDGGVYLNDQVSSFEVFNTTGCGWSPTPPPTTPTPTPTPTSVPIVCPSSGGAILYIHPNYDCNNQGAGHGYVMRSSTGWQNVPGDFQDQASSLYLPSGWSMRVWNGYDRAGNTACFNGSDNYLPDNNYDGDGSVNDSIRSFEVFSYQNCSEPPPPSCPASDSGGVILYQNPDYDCGGGGANEGYFVKTNIGGQDLPGGFKDKASSIAVPSGWSVKVYKDDYLGGSSACLNGSDTYLPDNSYDGGGTLDDSISSIEVFNAPNCALADCPQSGGVIFYHDMAHGCYGLGEDEGYVIRSVIGWQNMPASFDNQASSVRVPSGWSVLAYSGGNRTGSSRCLSWNYNDFSLDQYDDGNPMNDTISSFEVFNTGSCQVADTTPPTGGITSPTDGATVDSCPLLIQANASDSESGVDKVEFHVYFWSTSQWVHLGDDSTAPYSWNWDCSALVDQDVILTIHIWDKAGNETMDPGGYVHIKLRRNCPQSGGVLLYEHANYDCGGDPEGVGYVRRTTTGWQNVPRTFESVASSVRIPTGWSVRIWDWPDRTGSTKCLNASDSNFSGDQYGDGSLINDTLSSFEVFDQPDCPSSGCPQTGGVLFYQNAGFNCGGEPQDVGYVLRASAGSQNMPVGFNNKASSVRVPNGWSVLVFEKEDFGGAAACFSTDQSDFGLGRTFSGSSVLLNDQVSSFRVFNGPDCPDTIPPTGRLIRPHPGALLTGQVLLEAEATDNVGIAGVQFFAWYDDDWHFVANDSDGSDGYQVTWDVTGLAPKSGVCIDALILDLAWNRWDSVACDMLIVDHIYPVYLPLVLR